MSAAPFHDRFRTQLATLATDDAVFVVLPAGRTWRRTYGRFTPHASSYATLVYESREEPQALIRLEAFECRPSRSDAVHIDEVGWLQAARFPEDAGLPTLPAAVTNDSHVRVVRYRPGRRCTLAVEDPPQRYVKVFPDDRGARLYAESSELWRAAQRGELAFAVARPLAFDPAVRTFSQKALPGTPARARLACADGARVAALLGTASASLACARLTPSRRGGGRIQLDRCARSAGQLRQLLPTLGSTLHAIHTQLCELHRAAVLSELRPAHGAPHLPQWLVDGDAVALVDFDRHCLADPELDAAAVMVSMEEECEDGVALAAAFLDSYEAVAGPLRPGLLLAYRGQRLLAKALNAACALRVDADDRAGQRLRRLELELGGAG